MTCAGWASTGTPDRIGRTTADPTASRSAVRSTRRYFEALEGQGIAYPCFCTPLELEVSRRAQLGAGRPPRYAGTCRDLSPEQRRAKQAQGLTASLRFRVPCGRRIEFVDLVHGPQSFLSDDIGDFIVRRGDGTAAFFFSNAVDDACMGVTHVLRGEDHLANTPRQLLILEALGLRAPSYGHVSLILGPDGAPLSKRHGATSVREYRDSGYRAEALVNHLFRLGHSSGEHGLLDLEAMARAFDPAHLGRAAAHFDQQQLLVWQKEAAHHLAADEARAWLAGALPAGLDESAARAFIAAILPNVVLPEDAQPWARIVFGPPPALEPEGEQIVRKAGERLLRGRGAGRRAQRQRPAGDRRRGPGGDRKERRGALHAVALRAHRPRPRPGARAASQGHARRARRRRGSRASPDNSRFHPSRRRRHDPHPQLAHRRETAAPAHHARARCACMSAA